MWGMCFRLTDRRRIDGSAWRECWLPLCFVFCYENGRCIATRGEALTTVGILFCSRLIRLEEISNRGMESIDRRADDSFRQVGSRS